MATTQEVINQIRGASLLKSPEAINRLCDILILFRNEVQQVKSIVTQKQDIEGMKKIYDSFLQHEIRIGQIETYLNSADKEIKRMINRTDLLKQYFDTIKQAIKKKEFFEMKDRPPKEESDKMDDIITERERVIRDAIKKLSEEQETFSPKDLSVLTEISPSVVSTYITKYEKHGIIELVERKTNDLRSLSNQYKLLKDI